MYLIYYFPITNNMFILQEKSALWKEKHSS